MKQKVFCSESSVKNGWVRSCINMPMCSGVCTVHVGKPIIMARNYSR